MYDRNQQRNRLVTEVILCIAMVIWTITLAVTFNGTHFVGLMRINNISVSWMSKAEAENAVNTNAQTKVFLTNGVTYNIWWRDYGRTVNEGVIDRVFANRGSEKDVTLSAADTTIDTDAAVDFFAKFITDVEYEQHVTVTKEEIWEAFQQLLAGADVIQLKCITERQQQEM